MNKKRNERLLNEKGFVLVTALLVMLILTIIGIAATTNTSLELRIAGNDKLHKQTFYTAEGSAILGVEILEQNLNCVTGFASSPINGKITINTLDMAFNSYGDANYASKAIIAQTIMDNAKADFVFPIVGTEQSFGYVVGETRMQPGGTLVMAAGYERKGKSAAGGGVSLHYDVYSRHLGMDDSESIVLLGWRHLVGDESACQY